MPRRAPARSDDEMAGTPDEYCMFRYSGARTLCLRLTWGAPCAPPLCDNENKLLVNRRITVKSNLGSLHRTVVVALGGIADNQPDQAPGQHDVQRMPRIHQKNEIREKSPHGEAEDGSPRERPHLAGED